MNDVSDDWQQHLLKNAVGKEKLGVLLGIRDKKDKQYVKELTDFVKHYDEYGLLYSDGAGGYTHESYDSSAVAEPHQEMLEAEEKAFSYYIATTDDSMVEIQNSILKRQALYAQLHTDKINNFIKNEVVTTINENGEDVYEFTEDQFVVYEILKDLRDVTDFAFRHQLYRFDQMQSLKEEKIDE